MESNTTIDAYSTINVATSCLDLAQITSDVATGNRIITFHRKGSKSASSIDCTDKMWEPFVYPLLFFHAERGWGNDIRDRVRYPEYLVSKLLRHKMFYVFGTKWLNLSFIRFDDLVTNQ